MKLLVLFVSLLLTVQWIPGQLPSVVDAAATNCSDCQGLYNQDFPTCSVKTSFSGNVTWLFAADGATPMPNSVVVEGSFMHSDGTVYTTGYINSIVGGGVDFGGACGLLGTGTEGDLFISKHESCTGLCVWVRSYGNIQYQTGRSIKVDRDGNVYFAGETECMFGTTLSIGGNLEGAGGQTCGNSTSGKYNAFVYKLTPLGTVHIWHEFVNNQDFPVHTREVQLDETTPYQAAYWMTQQVTGPGVSGNGKINSHVNGFNAYASWASGQPVDCVIWKFNGLTGVLELANVIGDSSPSALKQCKGMSVNSDGSLVAVVSTTSGENAGTYEPCGVAASYGQGVDMRITILTGSTFACLTTYAYSSASAYGADVPSRVAFGLYNSIFVVGSSTNLTTGGGANGMVFDPLTALQTYDTDASRRDAWIVKLAITGGNNIDAQWAHSIASSGFDSALDVDADGHFGVAVTGFFTATAACLDVSGSCAADATSFYHSGSLANTHVFVLKFDTISGSNVWSRVYTLNTTDPSYSNPLSISAYGLEGYGFWTVTGIGLQSQPTEYIFDTFTYVPITTNTSFGYVFKEADTQFGFSNTSVVDGCVSTPCQNGGTCTFVYGDVATPLCACVPGYSGALCQTNIDECASNPCTDGIPCLDGVNSFSCSQCASYPCQNGGSCVSIGNSSYTCSCTGGFSGLVCQSNIDECASSPCQNSGTCVDASNSYTCTCAVGYSGGKCQTDINECGSSPCANGGTCTDALNSYSCVCAVGYSGASCTTNINECASTPCLNGATCVDGVNLYSCTCAAGYSGPACQTNIDECASTPCRNSGTCTDAVNSYTCACPVGYSGLICQTDINECASSPCTNGGTCVDALNQYTCTCAAGYSGPVCQTNIDECASSPCRNAGTCTDATNAYTCVCSVGFSGAYCQTDINECASSPCLNGATCTDALNRYACTCAGGYSGVQCQTNVDECVSSPCQHGGNCTDAVNAFVCTCNTGYTGNACQVCPAGFSGALCQTNIDECVSNPCANGGNCTDAVNSYTCVCNAGYSGSSCQTNINECASAPCKNGGTCTDSENSYACACQAGYSGLYCQTNINECASTPCFNDGTCVDAVNGFTCTCAAGFSGLQCQTDIDECASSPCRNSASCYDTTNSFFCMCPAGYTGVLCQTDVNECATSNGGCDTLSSCNNTVGSRTCGACPSGYVGTGTTTCFALNNTCASFPCQNGGTCSGTIDAFTCVCDAVFIGTLCQTDVNECATLNGGCDGLTNCTNLPGSFGCGPCPFGYIGTGTIGCISVDTACVSHPCQNGGTCSNTANSTYSCACASGFTGTMCQTDINECATSNGGCDTLTNCVNTAGSRVCAACPGTYTGTGETACLASGCTSIPCQNGATCSSTSINLFSCSCVSGYSGTVCQTDINECTSAPCQYGGTCTDTLNGFTCSCLNGFGGVLCQTINGCNSSPCMNGATCQSSGSNGFVFLCACAPGYSGVQCQTNINECASSPCKNGGTCTDATNLYTCVCAAGYSGLYCQTNIDDCASGPCQNAGTCTDGVDGFTCACTTSFNGTLCQTGRFACVSHPCQNDGLCQISGQSNYTCLCQPGFSGVNCTTNIDECASTPCQNGGNCTDAVNGFACNCTGVLGTGATCHITDCTSSPCMNGGVCTARLVTNSTDDPSTYTCACSTDFTGTNCQLLDLDIELGIRRPEIPQAIAITGIATLGTVTVASAGVIIWYMATAVSID